ncbi:MAG: hypothetical protein DSM106950_22890 [Stigonema ocellatum SAG 48.90 = DSM 106950]|nr:hypothetical protein [Stigonema ocellatum SAG 48.90 = DSM 106950]
MAFLVDTNVLLRSVEPSHPMYPDASNAINTLLRRGERLCIVPQNLIEFWNVYTRPTQRNGLGHTPAEAEAEINRLKTIFPLLLDTDVNKSNKIDVKQSCCLDGYFIKDYILISVFKRRTILSSTSSANPSNPDSNFGKGITELGAAGTLATLAAQVSAASIGQVVVATFGATTLTVSLPGVVAVFACGYLGLSVGKKIVNAIDRA